MSTRIALLIAGTLMTGMTYAQHSGTKTAVPKAKHKKTSDAHYGTASYYANKFNGRKTANGDIFSQKEMTAACNIIPLNTYVKVTNMRNKRQVIVLVNDRMHPKNKRLIDLSRSAASKLGYTGHGLTKVKVEVLGKTRPANYTSEAAVR